MEVEEHLIEASSQVDEIIEKEFLLREWFTRDCDPIQKIIDGLDIGWGGVQHWAAARLHLPANSLHLDSTCGYGTFLAQLGWHYPTAHLVGLNIDFSGPHSLAKPLLSEAGVNAELVQANALQMPFADDTFDSASCFLGLQDIEIGFGEDGTRKAIADTVRVLRPGGMLILLDEFRHERFNNLLEDLPISFIEQDERKLDIQWNSDEAMVAIKLYVQGWVDQMHLPGNDFSAKTEAYGIVLTRLKNEVEEQIAKRGFYCAFGPVRLILSQKDWKPI